MVASLYSGPIVFSQVLPTISREIISMERDYAMLVIAHRPSTVENADWIFSIEDGESVTSRTHDEIVSGDGTYTELNALQNGV